MAASAGDLLLRVEHVKFRSGGSSRSPVGTFSVFEDRVEWSDNASDEKFVISFSDIRGQRVSPPNKPKTQLQLCLHNDEQPTFVFLNPAGDRETHVKERDLVKETLQQALIRHRQVAHRAAAHLNRHDKNHEMEAKKKILEGNKHVEQLYKHLVSSKLISSHDFWSQYYSSGGTEDEKVGVSSGFLSSISQSESAGGVKLNLNVDTIQSIFKTYPAVEKKHLELVPHEMTEQEFWSKFFQSHYFHRERAVNPSPMDPFSDCVKTDDAEINKLLEQPIKKKMLDFGYLNDYFSNGNIDERIASLPSCSVSSKALIVRRCNYHSGRVLAAAHECEDSDQVAPNSNPNDNDSKNGRADEEAEEGERLVLESDELHGDNDEGSSNQILLSVHDESRARNQCVSEQSRAHAQRVLAFVTSNRDSLVEADLEDTESDDLFVNGTMSEEREGVGMFREDPESLNELMVLQDATAELLKHFWMCCPPTTPEMEVKLKRMVETLKNFGDNQLSAAEARFGAIGVKHCRDMMDLALKRYQAMRVGNGRKEMFSAKR